MIHVRSSERDPADFSVQKTFKANALCFINAATLLVLGDLLFSKRGVWKSVPRLNVITEEQAA